MSSPRARRGSPRGFVPTAAMALLAAHLVAATASAPARALGASEYEIKAAFLFNFAQFVEWPANAFQDADSPVAFCVLGHDPFGAVLERTLDGETIRNRRVLIRRFRRVAELESCQLVFVSASERARLADLLPALSSRPVLTVGEVEGFGSAGGIINFYLEDQRVRFEINQVAARRAGIEISSELLHLGKLVETDSAREASR